MAENMGLMEVDDISAGQSELDLAINAIEHNVRHIKAELAYKMSEVERVKKELSIKTKLLDRLYEEKYQITLEV